MPARGGGGSVLIIFSSIEFNLDFFKMVLSMIPLHIRYQQKI